MRSTILFLLLVVGTNSFASDKISGSLSCVLKKNHAQIAQESFDITLSQSGAGGIGTVQAQAGSYVCKSIGFAKNGKKQITNISLQLPSGDLILGSQDDGETGSNVVSVIFADGQTLDCWCSVEIK